MIPEKKIQLRFRIKETFNSITPNILGILILIAMFILSTLAFQPQKTIQIMLYDKKITKT